MSRSDLPLCMVIRDNSEQLPLAPHVLRVYKGEPVREYLHTRDTGLDAGDYTVEGMEQLIFIERKSPADLWASLFGKAPDNSVGEAMFNVDRLRREFLRASGHERKTLLVEADLGSFEEPWPRAIPGCAACALEYGGEGARPACREHPPRTMVAYARRRHIRNDRRGKGPESNVLAINGFVVSFLADYGVGTHWAGSRRGAELWLGEYCERLWSQAHDGPKAQVARDRGVALPWMREQVEAGVEEASDGERREQEQRPLVEPDVGPGQTEVDGATRPDGVRVHHEPRDGGPVAVEGGAHGQSGEAPEEPVLPGAGGVGSVGDVQDHDGRGDDAEARRSTAGSTVAHDMGEQDAAVGAGVTGGERAGLREVVGAGHGTAGAPAARGVPREGDSGRGRQAAPEATAGAGEAMGRGMGVEDVAALPCACGTPAQPSPHPRAAPGCCYSATPQPAPVDAGQVRARLDTDGGARVRVHGYARTLYRCTPVRAPGNDGFHNAGMIARLYPVLCDPAAPWVRPAAPPDERVTEILAGRAPLLGVADHAAAASRKRAGRPATKARRGRAGA